MIMILILILILIMIMIISSSSIMIMSNIFRGRQVASGGRRGEEGEGGR